MAIMNRQRTNIVCIRIKGIAQVQRFNSNWIDKINMQHAREGGAEARRQILSELNQYLACFGYNPVREKDIEWESSTVTPC